MRMKNKEDKKMKSKAQINQEVANKLDSMELSERARDIIARTEIRIMSEVFGGLDTPEEVERYIREEFPEE